MTIRTRIFIHAFGILILFALFQPLIRAQGFSRIFSSDKENDDKPDSPLYVAAGITDVDMKNNRILLRENVFIDDGTVNISCEKAVIILKDDKSDSSDQENAGSSENKSPMAVPAVKTKENTDKNNEQDNNFLENKSLSEAICTGNFTYKREDFVVLSRYAEYHSNDGLIRATNSKDERSNHTETENEKRGVLFLKEFLPADVHEEIVQKMLEDYNKNKAGTERPRNWTTLSDEVKRRFCEAELEENVLAFQGSEWAIATEIDFPAQGDGRKMARGVKHTSGIFF